jgi:hypothetical protein
MYTKYVSRVILLGLVSATQFLPVYAAEEPIVPTTYSDKLPAGLQSCFQYYRFGSVPITITSETTQLTQGAQLHAKISLHNENKYPITNAAVYVKIFYKKNFDKSSFGPDVIDFVKVADNIQLPTDGHADISYTYQIPSRLEPGTYQIAGYVNASDRYNLSGLSFTNDIVGSLFNFTVIGENLGSVRFDNTKIFAGTIGYHAAIFSPKASYTDGGFPISTIINNTTNRNFTGEIHWTVYSWDSINNKNILKEDVKEVQIDAHASTTVVYTVTDKAHTVYYVLGRLTEKGSTKTESIVTVRYIQEKDELAPIPRMAFSGVTSYPIKRSTTSAFMCVHSSGSSSAGDSKVVLEAIPTDPLEWILHFGSFGKKEYHGDIPGELSAISIPFNSDTSNVLIRATLYQKGVLVDSVETSYTCSTFGTSCNTYTYWIMFVVGIIATILILLFLKRRKAETVTTVM